MIHRENNYVEWALLLDDLDEVHEHLGDLIKKLATDPNYDETSFRIDLGHIYAHLNRAWNRRDHVGEMSDAQWEEATKFPTDIEPIG